MTTPIRVCVADDNAGFRKGLRLLLESLPDIQVVGEGTTAHDALVLAQSCRPDVLLLDVEMPEGAGSAATPSGLAILRQLHDAAPHIRVVVFSWHDRTAYILAAIRDGASGYLLKGASPDEVCAAIVAAHRGDLFVSHAVVPRLRAALRGLLSAGTIADMFVAEKLTASECQVLTLIGQKKTNEQIGSELHLAAQTVRNYVSSILQKLGVADREAARQVYISRLHAFGFDLPPD